MASLGFDRLYDVVPNVDRIRFRVLLAALQRELDSALTQARSAQAWQVSSNGELILSHVVSGSLFRDPTQVPVESVLLELQNRGISLSSIRTLCLSECNISTDSLLHVVTLVAQLPNVEVVDLSLNKLNMLSLARADPTAVQMLDKIATHTKKYLVLVGNAVQGYLPHGFTFSHGPKIIWFFHHIVESEANFKHAWESYCPKLQKKTSTEILCSHVHFYQRYWKQ